ncbi:MAG: hypothetical protein L6R40_000048 [Gallowayella cf. fulva]|nr:MAG: hypothetical protein L6R40_000048 [Xanthomendoza cf. fulva]
MPRPKRTKLAPSVPIIPFATTSRKPQTNLSPPVSSSRGTNGSDDSEGIVTTSKTGVNRRGVKPQAVFMSGALAAEDAGAKRPRPVSSRKRLELTRIAREGDYAKASEGFKLRRDANSAGEKLSGDTKKTERTHTTQITKDPNATIAPSRIAKAQATPLRENSVLAIENFKRRPRQPSLLQIAQAQHVAVDSEHDDTLDDFNPDDESTPFGKSGLDAHQERLSTSSSRQPSSRKRKLSTPEIQVPASQSHSFSGRTSSPASSLPDNVSDAVAEDSQPNPTLPPIPTSKTPLAPRPVDSDTMAPPESSSPVPSPQKRHQDLQSKTRTKKAATTSKPKLNSTNLRPQNEPSPIPPPHSPTPTQSPATTLPATRPPLKPLTTSALQNLLPRRRRRAKSSRNQENAVFEIHSSSEIDIDEDEDELNYRPGSKTVRKMAEKPKRGRPKGGKKGGEEG